MYGQVHALPQGCRLDCMASAYATEEQAHAVVQQLRREQGLLPAQSLVLKPTQASWLTFTHRSRSWNGGRHAEGQRRRADALLMALLGALAVGLAGMVWLLVDDSLSGSQSVMLLLLSPLAGAAAGCLAALLAPARPQFKQFNRNVRRELAAGHTVVLAHGVPAPQQAQVASVLREHSVGWCAVPATWRAL